jgi:hypothetical protein
VSRDHVPHLQNTKSASLYVSRHYNCCRCRATHAAGSRCFSLEARAQFPSPDAFSQASCGAPCASAGSCCRKATTSATKSYVMLPAAPRPQHCSIDLIVLLRDSSAFDASNRSSVHDFAVCRMRSAIQGTVRLCAVHCCAALPSAPVCHVTICCRNTDHRQQRPRSQVPPLSPGSRLKRLHSQGCR